MEAAPTEVAPGRAGACLAGGAWGGRRRTGCGGQVRKPSGVCPDGLAPYWAMLLSAEMGK